MLEAQTHTVDDMPKPALSIEVLLATVQSALVNLRFDSSPAFPGYKKTPPLWVQDGSKQLGGWIKRCHFSPWDILAAQKVYYYICQTRHLSRILGFMFFEIFGFSIFSHVAYQKSDKQFFIGN